MKKYIDPTGYHRILKTLYGDCLTEIIRLLNTSVYITNYNYKKSSYVIHTGVSFYTQTNQEMEIMYDLSANTLIVQPRNTKTGLSLPQLNGLKVKKGGINPEYFNVVFPMITCEYLYRDDKELYTLIAIDNTLIRTFFNRSDFRKLTFKNPTDKSVYIFSNIKVFIENKNKKSRELYPLNKKINKSIFLDPNGWIYKQEREFVSEDFYYEDE